MVPKAVEAKNAAVLPMPSGNARHADLDTLLAGVQAELAKGTKEPSAPNAVTTAAPPPERRLRAGGYFATMNID